MSFLTDRTVLIGTGTGVASGTFTFSNIPQKYSALYVVAISRGNGTNSPWGSMWLGMTINGDTGANYVNQVDNTVTTMCYAGQTPTGDNFLSSVPSMSEIFIGNYASGSYHKVIKSLWFVNGSTTAVSWSSSAGSGCFWKSTAAITSLTFATTLGGATFQAGTNFNLYGLP